VPEIRPARTARRTVDLSKPHVETDPELIVDLGGERVKIDRRFLQLSPEEKNETVDEIRASLTPVRQYAAVAFLPPLVTLVLGLLGAWVVSGFARKGAG
jgi:hypothetical protein